MPMAEIPHSSEPTDQVFQAFESHESQEDNLPEIIKKIDDCFEQMALGSKTTTYSRQLAFESTSDDVIQTKPITMLLTTIGDPETELHSRIDIRLPPSIAGSDTLHQSRYKQDPCIRITRGGKNEGVRAIFIPDTTTPQDLLQCLLQIDDLPDSIVHVVAEVASTLIRDRQYANPEFVGVVDISNEQFKQLWSTVLTDTEEVPTEVLWGQGFTSGDGQVTSLLRINTHLPLDNEHPVECVELNAGEFEYVVKTDKEGNRVHTFEETIADEDLPELTDDQRTGNPYMVVPVDALQHPDRGEGVFVMLAEDEFAVRQPMVGHAVIHPERGLTPDAIFGDSNDAQIHAELLHRRDIAKSLLSKEMTVERAQQVLTMVRELMTHPDLLANLKRKEP